MMGGHHAACGAAAWIALTTKTMVVIPAIGSVQIGMGLYPATSVGVITGALVTAGAALLPDIDHKKATLAYSLPPLSNGIAAGMGKLSGGHRHGTHSLLAVAAFTLVAWLLGLWTIQTDQFGDVAVGAGIVSILLTSFALKIFKITDRKPITPWILSVGLAVMIAMYAPEENGWLPLAVGMGVFIHILGDFITKQGVPWFGVFFFGFRWIPRPKVASLFWHKNGWMSLPIIQRTGNGTEWFICIFIGAYALYGVGYAVYEAIIAFAS